MADRFTLEIELGNEAMSDLHDVARALWALADRMSEENYPTEGTVRDANGNAVGRWEAT